MLLDSIEEPTFIPRLLFIIHPELPGASRRVASRRVETTTTTRSNSPETVARRGLRSIKF